MRRATALVLLVVMLHSPGLADVPAFPGAQGFGAMTPGGRGGDVIFVTNLNASGPGSLKAALEASGPRMIIFKVAGTIDWTSIGGLVQVRNPFVTVAGQTAPGGGILIKNGMMSVTTHDVIVRGLRFRVGDDRTGYSAGNRNGIEVIDQDAYNVIFDHCSISWGVDENVGVTGQAHDVTIQYCYVTEGLRCSIHPEGCHSKGLMANHSAGGNISFHHNVLASNVDRNPQLVSRGPIECVNNVVYNFQSGGRFDNGALVHFVGNRYMPGPDTRASDMGLIYGTSSALTSKAYVEGNIGPGRPTNSGNEWAITDAPLILQSLTHLFEPNIVPEDVDAIWPEILDQAGALPHDDVDLRMKDEILTGAGSWIDSQGEVGGWPQIAAGNPAPDSDSDGMPDDWEASMGLNPYSAADANADYDQDGYTNIEEYVNGILIPGDGTTGNGGGGNNLPSTFALYQNFPNPFNPSTTVGYVLDQDAQVVLSIYDLLGQPVRALLSAPQNAGFSQVTWDGTNDAGARVMSGVYVYRLTASGTNGETASQSRMMVLVK